MNQVRIKVADELYVVSTTTAHVSQLEKLQEVVFPTLADSQRLKTQHYLKHIEIFPEGQLVVLNKDAKVVGMTTTIRLSGKYLDNQHTFEELIEGGYCTSHDPAGEWLYGVDVGIHPDYRGKGLARALYSARQAVVRTLHLSGQYTMGMLSGFQSVSGKYSLDEYYNAVVAGKLSDPTVTTQMKIGFEPRGLVLNYLDDPVCGNACARLILPSSKMI